MADLAYTTLGGIIAGAPNTASDVTTAFTQAQTSINNVDAEQFTDALAQYTGVNNGSHVGRGKCIIATSEARTSTSYGTHTTPDQVTGIVVPSDGLLFIHYSATWQESVSGAARAAIFIGSNQLKYVDGSGAAPVVQETAHNNTATQNQPLYTIASANTLIGTTGTGGWADVTTGQSMAQPVVVDNLAAGTYTISVQTKSTSGSVTLSNRRLRVWVVGF